MSFYFESAADGLEWRGTLPPQLGPPGDGTLYVPLVLYRGGKAVTTQRYELRVVVVVGGGGATTAAAAPRLLLSVGTEEGLMVDMRLNLNTPGACLLGVTAAAQPCPGVWHVGVELRGRRFFLGAPTPNASPAF